MNTIFGQLNIHNKITNQSNNRIYTSYLEVHRIGNFDTRPDPNIREMHTCQPYRDFSDLAVLYRELLHLYRDLSLEKINHCESNNV